MSLPSVTPALRVDADVAYAQSFFSDCAAALSTLLNRAVAIEVGTAVLPPTEPLPSVLGLPWMSAGARFTRGLAGAHELIMSQPEALNLARLVLGEEALDTDTFTAEYHDALRETVNQMLSSASSSLRVFFGKPVGLASADLRAIENAESWQPHNASIVIGHLTVDGVPRAKMALTIPPSVRDEAAQAQSAAAPAKPAGHGPAMPGLDLILDIAMPVTVELGRTKMLIRDILALGPGSIIELEKLAGEPVDLLVNDRPIAKGEVVVIDENFGVRLTQISHASDRLRSIA
ncbi:MAG: flagellar motor switch protein FliN [Candidatus Rokubacteria bacterium]|nr:flagellar motor switch protein FliN [Candidatus Rokubacteria bacterium]